MIGLAGAHRSGKTTLAKAYAEKHSWEFAQTSVSAMFKELGHSPDESFDFRTRLSIQEQILAKMNRFYKENQGMQVITDRTPVDFMAYTMAEAIGESVSPADQDRFASYITACFDCTNRWFGGIIVVQPGIALEPAEGKAALNRAYCEHLNSLIIGLCCDRRLNAANFYIPKDRLEIGQRIKSIESALEKGMQRVVQEASAMESREFH